MHALPLIHDLAPDRAIQPLPTLTEECNSIEWRWAENKQYTAKSAYEKLSGGKIKDANVQIWKTKTPPTVRIFGYLLLRGKILTRDVLSKRKIHCQMNCVMCLNCGMETAIHLLFRCEYAASVWDELNRRMGFQCVLNQEDVLSIWEKNRSKIQEVNQRNGKQRGLYLYCVYAGIYGTKGIVSYSDRSGRNRLTYW